jgi:hypothetical protein
MESWSAHLSHILVAFIIEFDNEFEHRSPHRTTRTGGIGPWLTSMAMYSNCLRFVGDQPLTTKELTRVARTHTNLRGMQRWGYITVDPAPPKLIRATARGRQARAAWAPLFNLIEQRWQERFGHAEFDRLRQVLFASASQFELDLPDCLPILGYGLWSIGPDTKRQEPVAPDLTFSTLLSRVLLAFAMEFESHSVISLAIAANVVRLLSEQAMRVRDLPHRSGVSKEAINVALGFLRKISLAVVEPGPTVRLTDKGLNVQAASQNRIAQIEKSWPQTGALREALRPFTTEALFRGLEPYPDNWRASVRRPQVLPDFPMVLHRGGYPDGS